ncbi:ribosome small subunit-dependent GTPase A [Desulfovibrio ferrophilus]|uniref:Small ribosomal subunit biogenesis GTPase RsgA n=1 Tax=Desulfovibrio ferrophilus TaxID=241368 RepID=A0A2Z6AWC6_9BACT|nr:ribosome small subunit-dependent GTPase A [Desulfovibrio ferrophilus]BBD07557.1 ribosome small subunit-dependent GTPase A [Desulfovibrio ferrophilus]
MTNHKELQADTSVAPTTLLKLGWDNHFDRQLATITTTYAHIARVISVQRGLFLVSDGNSEWLCSPAGRLLHSHKGDYPVTGDWVFIDDTVVTGVLPRKNILSRGEAGSRGGRTGATTREQAIASNLDAVFIVCGLDRDFNIRRLERYLTLVYNCGLSPVVVLTKADLHEDSESFRMEVETIAFGVPVVLTSMLDGRGRSELESHLGGGQTVAMVGSSGAGKSTLANMLYGNDIQSTNAVSSSVGKGRHTTTVRELIRMPQGGMLMDNPGIREIAFHEDGHGVESAFTEIQELAEKCRFADCTHQHEPGCAVLCAVETGELLPDRLESYHKMKREMQYLSDRRSKSADRVEKERWQYVALLKKSMYKKNK